MSDPKAGATADNTRNLQVVAAGAVICACLWSWFTFSGPFRGLIDLELRLFGTYWEAPTGFVLGMGALVVALVAATLVKHAFPDLSASAVDALVALAFVALSVAALAKAAELWRTASQMPGLDGPVQVVALDSLGTGAPPTGHVRLVGLPDHRRAVTLRFRYRARAHVESYVPMTSRRPGEGRDAVRILASIRGSDESTVGTVPADPQGVLLAVGIDIRTVYELRRNGLPVAEHPYVLFWPGDDVSTDTYIEAALLALPILLFWPFAAVDRLRKRRSGGASTASAAQPLHNPAPAPVAPAPAADTPAPDAEWRIRDVSPAGVALAFALATLFMLWHWGWALPDAFTRWGFTGAGLLLLASLAFDMLERSRRRSATPASAPAPGAALLYVMRDAPFGGPSYFRVDVDGIRVAVLKANQYTVAALQPGTHLLAVNGRISVARDTVERFDVTAGDAVFYRLKVPFIGRPSLARVMDAEGARRTLARLKFQG